jgi:regulator of protease activity HflC (stomatin/prohibitin superfamily)
MDGQIADPYTASQGYVLNDAPRLNAGFLLTGDSSVVHLEAQIFYQIADPVAYMIAADHVGPALQRLFLASTVNVLAGRDLDSVLVARPEIASQNTEAMQRELLRANLMNAVNRRLETLGDQGAGLGIRVSRVDLVPSIPNGAKTAFDSVLVVSQQADQNVAQARTMASLAMQRAQSDRDRITTDATAKAEEAVSAATVATASITALGNNSHDMSQAMQMSRLYYDRIGPIIAKAGRVESLGPEGSVRLLLPAAPTGRPSAGGTP